ncbi:hypothetical protein JRO89_XS08G0256100 [Xanthoceras sorbifolium]|uniref:Uncharacterized protein n=1 Tax=Xanthoceras sorbifolium TaxID=99658 RepID=A0ABQ8HRF8_9ROSI|nr:hypothetical protein JRO89_XS08G0256100 [Xanthoceras sorbifolium]
MGEGARIKASALANPPYIFESAFSILFKPSTITKNGIFNVLPTSNKSFPSQIHNHPCLSFPVSISVPNQNPTKLTFQLCLAAKSQTGPVKKRSSSPPNGKKKKKKEKNDNSNSVKQLTWNDVDVVDDETELSNSESFGYHTTPLPKPPAGFVVDDTGRVLMASNKRIATIVDSTNNYPLECVIRRLFTSSRGDECMLLCPVDTPVQILRSTNIDGWSAVSDKEVEGILPTAAYALAKIHMHLVHSGFCYTARGGFCYSEDDIFDFRTGNDPLLNSLCSLNHLTSFDSLLFRSIEQISDDGQDVDGVPTEGIEITCFHLDGAHYMIYTPSDPLLFVAVKDGNGQLQIADDVSNLAHFMTGIV